MSINRRNFLHLSTGLCLASALPSVQLNAQIEKKMNELKIERVTVNLGLEKPFRALHISDTHFCFADERENQRKRNLAAARSRYFKNYEVNFDAALAYAQKNSHLLLHTGDLIDFVSEKNLEVVEAKFAGQNCFVSSGNHEFSQYVGEAKEDAAYKAQSFERVQKAFPNDLTFCSRIVNGVNFVAIDDVYYDFTADQLAKFKEEVKKGLPIVMLCHVPLFTPELYDYSMSRGAGCAYVTGAPAEKVASYSAHRREQQTANEPTLEFMAWLREQSMVKAIFCGHLHCFWQGQFSPHTRQYVVAANYAGNVYEIEFK